MTNSRFLCKGCGERQRFPAYRKVGLSNVCSEECLKAMSQTAAQPAKPNSGTGKTKKSEIPQPTRQSVHDRDHDRCVFCGRVAGYSPLHCHHVCYLSEGVDHSRHNIILLCRTCHQHVHSDKHRWKPVLLAYLWKVEVEGKRYRIPRLERECFPERFVV